MAPAPALANGSATATVSSQAAIIRRLTLVKTADLQFGTNIGGNTTGTVVVGPSGSVSSTGGVVRAGGTTSAAQFYAFSQRNETASVKIGANFINITRLGGGATMRVDTFTISSTPPSTLSTTNTTFTLNTPNGIFPFTIGATLHVGVHQMPGTYTGTFSVTMTYN
ncbi:MAG TPA: DUF4402 domain-containing protein [Sphingomonadaceae bacterium]